MTINNTMQVEHFCTLFDRHYLPLGMALHQSLLTQAQSFHLWILCMDEEVEQQLQQLDLPQVTLIPLKALETSELLSVKTERSPGEYCWTLTPFIFQGVFDRDPNIQQVTYLDADLFFFDDPRVLLRELPDHKHVLITDHAYAPEYDKSSLSGKFCVQFLTFKRTESAYKVMKWWQDRCLEWCFNRYEDGKFGDQKYLDCWPEKFQEEVYIIQQTDKTLAPWNINFFNLKSPGKLNPVFYHFHSLRIINPTKARLYIGYRLHKYALSFYWPYINALQDAIRKMTLQGISVSCLPMRTDLAEKIQNIRRVIFKMTCYKVINK
jgi:hypothetical protein